MAALYNITLTTNWTPELYPKQFPTWRPPAQWSQVWGYSHAKPHILYEIGSVASDGVASFVETGSSDSLLSDLDLSSVLDIVTSPAITSGAGTSRTTVFVDGTYSKVCDCLLRLEADYVPPSGVTDVQAGPLSGLVCWCGQPRPLRGWSARGLS